MTADSPTGVALGKGREAARHALLVERSDTFRLLVRAGFLARALTYGVIGGVAVALALGAGGRSGSTNQQGALSLIAKAPLGGVVVGIAALGLLMYAIWKLSLAIIGTGPEGAGGVSVGDRISNLAGAAAYFGFFAVAVEVLFGSSGNGTAKERHTAASREHRPRCAARSHVRARPGRIVRKARW